MGFIGHLFLFAGYTLVYAAVAKGGEFATDPWNGILADAYTGSAVGDSSLTVQNNGQAVVAYAGKKARPRLNNNPVNASGTPAHGGTF